MHTTYPTNYGSNTQKANKCGNVIDINFHIDAVDNNKDYTIDYDRCRNKQKERKQVLDSCFNAELSVNPVQVCFR